MVVLLIFMMFKCFQRYKKINLGHTTITDEWSSEQSHKNFRTDRLFFCNPEKAVCVKGEQIARVSHIWFLIARLKEENSVFEFSI